MFYYLFDLFVGSLSFLNIFQYITFRSSLAGITSFFIIIFFTPKFIELMNNKNFKENISSYLKSHEKKKGTPNMGGIAIGGSILISSLLFGNFNNTNFMVILVSYLAFALSGFADDFIKLKKGKGLTIFKKISNYYNINNNNILYKRQQWISVFKSNIQQHLHRSAVHQGTF
jgi:phospho-N-acetylmuramoyl-pentapeptide-transferase